MSPDYFHRVQWLKNKGREGSRGSTDSTPPPINAWEKSFFGKWINPPVKTLRDKTLIQIMSACVTCAAVSQQGRCSGAQSLHQSAQLQEAADQQVLAGRHVPGWRSVLRVAVSQSRICREQQESVPEDRPDVSSVDSMVDEDLQPKPPGTSVSVSRWRCVAPHSALEEFLLHVWRYIIIIIIYYYFPVW